MSKTIMSGKQFGVLLGLIILIAFLSIMALDENYRQDQEIEELREQMGNYELITVCDGISCEPAISKIDSHRVYPLTQGEIK